MAPRWRNSWETRTWRPRWVARWETRSGCLNLARRILWWPRISTTIVDETLMRSIWPPSRHKLFASIVCIAPSCNSTLHSYSTLKHYYLGIAFTASSPLPPLYWRSSGKLHELKWGHFGLEDSDEEDASPIICRRCRWMQRQSFNYITQLLPNCVCLKVRQMSSCNPRKIGTSFTFVERQRIVNSCIVHGFQQMPPLDIPPSSAEQSIWDSPPVRFYKVK